MKKKRECWIGEDGYCHVPLANGKGEAITDAKFINEINKSNWCIGGGRVMSNINGTTVGLHKLIFCLENKIDLKEFFEIIHINKNNLDNRISNLAKKEIRNCYIGEDGYCHVPLANGKGEAITDAEFIDKVNKYSWRLDTRDGYALADNENGKVLKMHRYCFLLKFKNIKEKCGIDHIDRNKLNNLISNLREATDAQNQLNTGINNRSKTRFKGVRMIDNGLYEAGINLNNKRIYIGTFKTAEEAAWNYDLFAYHKDPEFSFLNFPKNIDQYKSRISPIKINNNENAHSFIGVRHRGNKFYATCRHHRKHINIGCFNDAKLAAMARDLYVIKHNINTKLNFLLENYEEQLNKELSQMVLSKAS